MRPGWLQQPGRAELRAVKPEESRRMESNHARRPTAPSHAAAYPSVDRWEWLDVVRRARLGRTTKAVAVMLATYADRDGTHIFPGLARLAVVCEMNYNTVQRALADLRAMGLIERVYHSGSRGRADEYQLTHADGVADRVPTPAQIELEIQRVRRPWSGKPRTGGRGEVTDEDTAPHPGAQGEDETADEPTSPIGTNDSEPTSPIGAYVPHPSARVPTSHEHEHLTTTSHIAAAVRTAVTVTREATPDQDPIFTGEEDKPRLRLVTDIRRGLGFCVECYAVGKTVLAADEVSGSACSMHLRAVAS